MSLSVAAALLKQLIEDVSSQVAWLVLGVSQSCGAFALALTQLLAPWLGLDFSRALNIVPSELIRLRMVALLFSVAMKSTYSAIRSAVAGRLGCSLVRTKIRIAESLIGRRGGYFRKRAVELFEELVNHVIISFELLKYMV